MSEDIPSPRLGSSADLARRLDRLEMNHEQLAKEVSALSGTIQRVEQNQTHLEELNRLRFNALDTSVGTLSSKLDNFILRVEGLITGEVQTPMMRTGEELVADYRKWRESVDHQLEDLIDDREKVELISRERERVASETRTRFQWRLGLIAAVSASSSSAIFAAILRIAFPTH